MKSIRRFLVIVLLAIVTLANFVAAVRGYLGSMKEAEILFNQRMLQQVDLLNYTLPGLLNQIESTDKPVYFPARLSDAESALEFQWINNDGRLLARSHAMPDEVIAPLQQGFTFINFNHYRWHVLVVPSVDKNTWFIIAERDDQRFRLAESMIVKAVYPMVVAIPIIGVIIWLLLGFGLRPVSRLAHELQLREATDLHPLAQEQMPIELQQLAHSANQLLLRLDASFAREKRFSADAAHELRTPIAGLKIHCENLLHAPQVSTQALLKLQAGIERMSYLVEQILMLNRVTPDHFMGKFEPVNISQLAKQVIVDQSEALIAKDHQIEFEGDECWVSGDRLALETLLSNLVSNAIKYTPRSGHIHVNTWLRGNNVVVEIMDNGPGIPNGEYDRVFDRFYRIGGDHHNSQIPGCGLGLSIVKQVVDLHGAQIKLTQSRLEHGLLVMVTFAAIAAPSSNKNQYKSFQQPSTITEYDSEKNTHLDTVTPEDEYGVRK